MVNDGTVTLMAFRPCSVLTKIGAFDRARPKQTQRPARCRGLRSIPLLVVPLAMPYRASGNYASADPFDLVHSRWWRPGRSQAEGVFQARRSLLNFFVGRTIRTIGTD